VAAMAAEWFARHLLPAEPPQKLRD